MTSLPIDASFVVLSLDPAATVAHLNNKPLTAACELLSRKKYVAYLGEGCRTFRPWVPYNSWPFYLVFQGLRPEDPDEGITPEMSVPILPNVSHPSSRKPLNPGKPLPWQDCYISEFVKFEARCVTIVTEQQPEYEASQQEAFRVEKMFGRDVDRHLARLCAQEPQLQPSSLGEISGDSTESLDHDTVFDAERPEESPNSSTASLLETSQLRVATSELQTTSREGSDECVEQGTDFFLSETSDGRMDSEMIVVAVSYDLSSVDKVNDPDDFFKEVEILNELRYNLTKLGPRGCVRRKGTSSSMASRRSSQYFGKRISRFFRGIASSACQAIKQ